jgi:hypothetical protein
MKAVVLLFIASPFARIGGDRSGEAAATLRSLTRRPRMTENTCCATKIAELEATIQRLEREYTAIEETSEKRIRALANQRDSFRISRDEAEKERAEADKDIESYKKERDASLRRISQLEQDYSILIEERDEARLECARVEGLLTENKVLRYSLRTDFLALEKDHDRVVKERDELRDLLTTPMPAPVDETTLAQDLAAALNRHSMENGSNTPDFILADYLIGCLMAFNTNVNQRSTWYGHRCQPGLCAHGDQTA